MAPPTQKKSVEPKKSSQNKPTNNAKALEEASALDNPDEIERKAVEIRLKLQSEWKKGSDRNAAALDSMLEVAKVHPVDPILLTKLEYIPLQHPTGPAFGEELLIARDILEIGAKASVAKKSEEGIAEFERYIAQLKQYYFDLRKMFRKDSESMYEILGMNLLKLLSQNRISEFHTELELFVHPDYNAVLNNPYIKKAVEIEQFLTEGRYKKILILHTATEEDLKKSGLTSSGFKYFIDRVVDSSRGVIADVIEKAFDKLHPDAAAQDLHIKNLKILEDFAQQRNWAQASDGYYYFNQGTKTTEILPAEQLAKDALKYAKELELIV